MSDKLLLGRNCVVTGSSTGIGKEVARALALAGATVVLGARSRERGEEARNQLENATGNPNLSFVEVDLSSTERTRRFARDVAGRFGALHVLVNNAGVWLNDKRTNDRGIELTWATNVLGYFTLTNELLPLLEKGGTGERSSRIVNVASEAAGGLDLSDVNFERRGWSGVSAYRQSKQADRMMSWALARRLRGKPVTVNAMHPGWVATELFREGVFGFVAGVASRAFARPPAKGAETAAWLAASTEVEGESGKFWVDKKERPCRFRGEPKEEALWKLCEEMTCAAAPAPARASSSSANAE
jgi:NAD(P)-dependent dehydrogenase (short-subunit alcohol dehydrogenase family)